MATSVSQSSGPREGGLALGVGFTLLVSLCLALIGTFAKSLSPSLSPVLIVFFQYALSLLFLLPWLLRGGVADLRTRRIGLLIMWSIFGLGSQLLLFVALSAIPLVEAVLLANSSPLFIPLVVLAWERTPIGRALWASLAIGFAGVVLILQPGQGTFSWAIPVALGAGACSAVGLVTISRLESTEPARRMLFWYFLLSAVLVSPGLALHWSTPAGGSWVTLVGVGLAMALAQIFTIRAYAAAPPEQLAPFNYSVVVFSALIGWVIFHEVPNWLTGLGIVLVTLGGVLSTYHRRAAPAPVLAQPVRSAT